MRRENGKYEQAVNRQYEAWQYQESLAKVCCGGIPLLASTSLGINTDYNHRSRLAHGPSSTLPMLTAGVRPRSKGPRRKCRPGSLPNAKLATCST